MDLSKEVYIDRKRLLQTALEENLELVLQKSCQWIAQWIQRRHQHFPREKKGGLQVDILYLSV